MRNKCLSFGYLQFLAAEEVGFPQEGEGSEVTALGAVGIMVVLAGALVEMSTWAGVNSLVVVGVRRGMGEMDITKEEVEVAVETDQSTMQFLHKTYSS